MKIVLLASTQQKEELTAQQSRVEGLLWPAEIESLENVGIADACIDLQFSNTPERIALLAKLNTRLRIVNSAIPLEGTDCEFVRINGWNSFLKRSIVEAAGPTSLRQMAEGLFATFNKKVSWVADITGFISLRVVASVINEAYFALEKNVSTKKEIDIAMKLGTNYPYGPFEWTETIGVNNVYQLLTRLSVEAERYKPSSLLKKEAEL